MLKTSLKNFVSYRGHSDMSEKELICMLIKSLEEISAYQWGDSDNINDMDNTIEYMRAIADVAIAEAKGGNYER